MEMKDAAEVCSERVVLFYSICREQPYNMVACKWATYAIHARMRRLYK